MQDHNPTNIIKKMLKVPFWEEISDQNLFDMNFEDKVSLQQSVDKDSESWNELNKIWEWTSSNPVEDFKRKFSTNPFTNYKDLEIDDPFWIILIDGRMYFIGLPEHCLGFFFIGIYYLSNLGSERLLLSDLKLISSKLYQKGSP